ncbi:CTLH/CRA C-terminal to lish motif domain-containing protein [Entophlyctis helioformis]|nr:CTLH/CRA C-terminal to lish motif domain-containing protein [Entophlyctis helioformis]
MATGAQGIHQQTDDAAIEAYEQTPPPEPDTVHALIYDYLVHNCYSATAYSFGSAAQLDRQRFKSGTSGTGSGTGGGGVNGRGGVGGLATDAQTTADMDVDDSNDSAAVPPSRSSNSNNNNSNADGDHPMTDTSSSLAVGGMAVVPQPTPLLAAAAGGSAGSADGPVRTLEARKYLVGLVLAGKMTEAIGYCEQTFPGMLSAGTVEALDVRFALQCQQFIEYMRRSAPEALAFAQEELGKFAYMNPKYSESLQDVIALIAYTNPEASPLSPYMSQTRREQVASALNSYILSYHGAPSQTAIERLVAQATVVRDHMHSDSAKDKKGAANKVRLSPSLVVYPKWQLSAFIGA